MVNQPKRYIQSDARSRIVGELGIPTAEFHRYAAGIADISQVSQYMYVGTGSPEGVVEASAPSIYLNLSGGASTTFYVKESGSGNTGWVGK